ncbi:MAG: RraA family protein [Geminicoccaceae bacterium]|nr:MAG: RraA family protein [Geminicoccaceae bacterium]
MRYTIKDMPPQLPSALVEKLQRVETATVGHKRQLGFVDRGIQCLLGGHRRIAGTAVTLALPGQDSTLLHHVIQFLRPGDVLVIDRLGDTKHACLGGGVAVAIKATGCAGVILDGPATDLPEIELYDLPVWSRGLAPITTRLYDVGGAFNVDVCCGGAVVHPGDAIVADFSGVLVMPPDEAEADADWALGKQAAEPASHEAIKAGAKLGERTGASKMVEADQKAST